MEEMRFHASKLNQASLIAIALVLGVFSAAMIYWAILTIYNGLSVQRLMQVLFVTLCPIALFVFTCHGLSLSITSKDPIVVLNKNGIHFPLQKGDPIPWLDIRLAEYSRHQIMIYLKAGKLHEGSNTVYVNVSPIAEPKKLVASINSLRKSQVAGS